MVEQWQGSSDEYKNHPLGKIRPIPSITKTVSFATKVSLNDTLDVLKNYGEVYKLNYYDSFTRSSFDIKFKLLSISNVPDDTSNEVLEGMGVIILEKDNFNDNYKV